MSSIAQNVISGVAAGAGVVAAGAGVVGVTYAVATYRQMHNGGNNAGHRDGDIEFNAVRLVHPETFEVQLIGACILRRPMVKATTPRPPVFSIQRQLIRASPSTLLLLDKLERFCVRGLHVVHTVCHKNKCAPPYLSNPVRFWPRRSCHIVER
ncbi:hypothetical protein C8F04DRAFT_1404976, partial [Mycena alexandri]